MSSAPEREPQHRSARAACLSGSAAPVACEGAAPWSPARMTDLHALWLVGGGRRSAAHARRQRAEGRGTGACRRKPGASHAWALRWHVKAGAQHMRVRDEVTDAIPPSLRALLDVLDRPRGIARLGHGVGDHLTMLLRATVPATASKPDRPLPVRPRQASGRHCRLRSSRPPTFHQASSCTDGSFVVLRVACVVFLHWPVCLLLE